MRLLCGQRHGPSCSQCPHNSTVTAAPGARVSTLGGRSKSATKTTTLLLIRTQLDRCESPPRHKGSARRSRSSGSFAPWTDRVRVTPEQATEGLRDTDHRVHHHPTGSGGPLLHRIRSGALRAGQPDHPSDHRSPVRERRSAWRCCRYVRSWRPQPWPRLRVVVEVGGERCVAFRPDAPRGRQVAGPLSVVSCYGGAARPRPTSPW